MDLGQIQGAHGRVCVCLCVVNQKGEVLTD